MLSVKTPEEIDSVELAMLLWSTTVLPNVELVEIWSLYDVAPVTSVQSSVGVTVTAAAGGGATGDGAITDVVKSRLLEKALSP